MFNVHDKFEKFYELHVKLDNKTLDQLKDYQDLNKDRLSTGLEKLGFKMPQRFRYQGSYPMHTMVQYDDDAYDLDIAVIFNRADLPSSPLDARKRVCDAIKEDKTNFSKEPEVRTNAVTVWYSDGYHIDFAVYRRSLNGFSVENIEHAGVNWTSRDPMDITNWFNEKVVELSPSKEYGAKIEPNQLRRIVQLLKKFSKSRSNWNLPGGLILSALAVENYKPDPFRDDLAFYNTLMAIQSTLGISLEVRNPILPDLLLTYKDEYTNQVRRLRDQLEYSMNGLSLLFESHCDEIKAFKVWHEFFNHDYWNSLVEGTRFLKSESLYASSSGLVSTTKPEEKAILIPHNRNYGE